MSDAVPTFHIVTHAHSGHVIYFTDDPAYEPPVDADCYLVNRHQGGLPEGLSLGNCWKWQYADGVFTEHTPLARAGGAGQRSASPPAGSSSSLTEHNRRALLRLLRETIDAVRTPHQPSCVGGEAMRLLKLAEAHAWLESPGSHPPGSLLQTTALARGIPLTEAAELIIRAAEDAAEAMTTSEQVREQFACAIAVASSDDDLRQLRHWLVDHLYPELSERFKLGSDPLDGPGMDEPLADSLREHEAARLRAQLRDRINRKRAHLHSDYIQNEAIVQHKARLAQLIMANNGEKPADIDCSVIEAYALARGLPLGGAAAVILDAINKAALVLVETEQEKERLLARIDAITTLRDVRNLSQALRGL